MEKAKYVTKSGQSGTLPTSNVSSSKSPEVAREIGILPEIDLLGENIEMLNSALARLMNRMAMVLRPEPMNGTEQVKHENRSPLYNTLTIHNDQLVALICMVNGLADSVDV